MLLFQVVSTPGVSRFIVDDGYAIAKSLSLSVLYSTVPLSGGQHPRPLGSPRRTPHHLGAPIKSRSLSAS